MLGYRLKSFGLSDIGYVRDNNEDVFVLLPDINFFILADGMGGHRAGEVAARQAVDSLAQTVSEMVAKEPKEQNLQLEEAYGMICYALEQANSYVFLQAQGSSDLAGMGTTICCLYFHPMGVIYGHVGDSRIYRIRRGSIDQLTRDHSLVREMVDKGYLVEGEQDECSFKNVITMAIGTSPDIEPAVHMDEVQHGDIFIMCTDGLTDMMDEGDILRIVRSTDSVETMARELVDEAKVRGGRDNVTVLAIRVVA